MYFREIKPQISIFLTLGGLFLFPNTTKAADSDIVINEIAAYESSGCEWVEIFNKGSVPVDMQGWKFWENDTNHRLAISSSSLQADWQIEPGEYAIIAQDDKKLFTSSCGNRYSSPAGTVFDSSWSSLKEDGELIGLKDADGNVIEQFTYIPAKDFSLERNNSSLVDYSTGNWHENVSGNSFGRVNSVISSSPPPTPPTPTPTPVVTPPSSSPPPATTTVVVPSLAPVSAATVATTTQIIQQPAVVPSVQTPVINSPPPAVSSVVTNITTQDNIITSSVSTPSTTATNSQLETDTDAAGEIATVRGFVIVPPGVFSTLFFYLSPTKNDAYVSASAIQVYFSKKQFPEMKNGDLFEVTGRWSKIITEKRLLIGNAEDIKRIGRISSPFALRSQMAKINSSARGKLVEIQGEITDVKSGYLYVDDGGGEIMITVKGGTGISTKQFKLGDTVSVIGLVTKKADGSFEVLPRSKDDIVLLNDSSVKGAVRGEKITATSAIETPAKQTNIKTIEQVLSAGAVGLSVLFIGLVARTHGPVALSGIHRAILFLGSFIKRKKDSV